MRGASAERGDVPGLSDLRARLLRRLLLRWRVDVQRDVQTVRCFGSTARNRSRRQSDGALLLLEGELERNDLQLKRVDSSDQHRPSRALGVSPSCFPESSFAQDEESSARASLSTGVLRLRVLRGDVRLLTLRRYRRVTREVHGSVGVTVGLVTATAAMKCSFGQRELLGEAAACAAATCAPAECACAFTIVLSIRTSELGAPIEMVASRKRRGSPLGPGRVSFATVGRTARRCAS